jgi:predicted naringenin-chalcone synthase
VIESYIAAVGTAVPSLSLDQEQAMAIVRKHYFPRLQRRNRVIAEKVFSHPGITRRYFAVDTPETLIDEDPDKRIDRFTGYSVSLSIAAAKKAMSECGLQPGDIDALVVNTCTGYICPGISSYLIEKMGLRPTIAAFDLVGSGCGGAMTNLQMCRALLRGGNVRVALSVAVEVCSAAYQMGDDSSLIVSNALFGDGAAAAVVWNRPEGLLMGDSLSRHFPEFREHIRFVYRNGRLHNQLSQRLPLIAARGVKQTIVELLRKHGVGPGEIQHWAFHPGGEHVISSVADALGLSDHDMRHTRWVLSRYGNISSPSILFVVKRIIDTGMAAGDRCIMTAFGAGMSVHSLVIRG